jgi:hypothetical protein
MGCPDPAGWSLLCAIWRWRVIIGGLVSIMSTPSGITLVKTSGEMVRVSMGWREAQHNVSSGGKRCRYYILKRERR